ncbi:MAG: oxygen-dependent coproporphyrinogen oxidase [Gammaproteobacteria bacterium]|nr:oxygen-dependent coproporphyrinogen oxidase [Gammaproteobacteria bacterium]
MNTALAYFTNLQINIIRAIEKLDGNKFYLDHWHKDNHSPLQGYGITGILENGQVFERAGCSFSSIRGSNLPSAATQKRPELAGCAFQAMGVSLVFHPHNPYLPTVHMNVRLFKVEYPHVPEQELVWYGGGMDLTPYLPFAEDAKHFHGVCKSTLEVFGHDLYEQFKKNCDDYFFLPHRHEQRGIGGIFFDDFHAFDKDTNFQLLQAVGDSLLPAYLPIALKRKDLPYSQDELDFLYYRRGRYVEFNLIHDRGTHFGLRSGGRTESILMSLPPKVTWSYLPSQRIKDLENELVTKYLIPRQWL